MRQICVLVLAALIASGNANGGTEAMSETTESAFEQSLESRYADSNGVKIHYKTAGEGPLVVFVHGFPDFWYSWIHQMEGLADGYQVAALDTRGYNLSDQPQGVENYDMTLLVGDVAAVIAKEGRERAIIVGHDWGGMIAWSFAMGLPQMTEKLIIVNLPHPAGMTRELANNEDQQKNSQYARDFQKPGSHNALSAEGLAQFLAMGDPQKGAKYQAAFAQSSFEGMMNYYKANYPGGTDGNVGAPSFPKVQAPVLQFHGLDDTALHHYGLNKTWDHLEQDYTLVTIPGVGHWAHHEKPELVTGTMRFWLDMRR
mgnify:CR=1 FL=1